MEPAIDLQSILLLVLIIGVGIAIFKMAKSILKAIGFVLVMSLVWYFWQGGTVDELQEKGERLKANGTKLYFKNETVSGMMERFCSADRQNKLKCECVVTPVYNDLTSRLSTSDLAKLDQDDDLRLTEIRKSLKNQRQFILDCGTKKEGKAFLKTMQILFEKAGESLENLQSK